MRWRHSNTITPCISWYDCANKPWTCCCKHHPCQNKKTVDPISVVSLAVGPNPWGSLNRPTITVLNLLNPLHRIQHFYMHHHHFDIDAWLQLWRITVAAILPRKHLVKYPTLREISICCWSWGGSRISLCCAFSQLFQKTGSYMKPPFVLQNQKGKTRKESHIFTFLFENWLIH